MTARPGYVVSSHRDDPIPYTPEPTTIHLSILDPSPTAIIAEARRCGWTPEQLARCFPGMPLDDAAAILAQGG